MKYTISDHLTLADVKSDDYKLACEWAKNINEKNFDDNVCYKGKLLKIVSVEIAKSRGVVVPWITFYSADYSHVYKISANGYDSDDNYTVDYVSK